MIDDSVFLHFRPRFHIFGTISDGRKWTTCTPLPCSMYTG